MRKVEEVRLFIGINGADQQVGKGQIELGASLAVYIFVGPASEHAVQQHTCRFAAQRKVKGKIQCRVLQIFWEL
ncbi:hypothetical protein [Pseudomonas sp. UFMG81]|uniref:hypothetical protein n=1 Tax=Pseudomonas sp. UFMG81 TaxID=2745936 RepID=UPI00188DCF86|nr:hypothetical protein [Pseudomonas sp. UFMG81]